MICFSSGLVSVGVVCWITGVVAGRVTRFVEDAGVFAVVAVGEDSRLSNGSREEVTPVVDALGD